MYINNYSFNYIMKKNKYLDALIETLGDFKNWEFVGGNSKMSNINRFYLKFGRGFKFPEKTDKCVCGHEIRENCYLFNLINGTIEIVGNCCVSRFLPDKDSKKLKCRECNTPHSNKKHNYCNGCAKCIHDKWVIDCNSCGFELKNAFEINDVSHERSFLFPLIAEEKQKKFIFLDQQYAEIMEINRQKKIDITIWKKRNDKDYHSKMYNYVWISYGIKNNRLWLKIDNEFMNEHNIVFDVNDEYMTQQNIDAYLNNHFNKSSNVCKDFPSYNDF